MKAAQIEAGKKYENKDGSEVRTVTLVDMKNGILRYTLHASKRALIKPRSYEITLQQFAVWATRPAGTSKNKSQVGDKFVKWVQGAQG